MTQVERKPGQTTSGEPKLTRRQFLESVVALGASAALSACGIGEKPSPEQPTETPTPTETILHKAPTQTPSPTETISPTKAPTQEYFPIPEPTLTPEPTSTPEVVSIPGIILTKEYLRDAFAGGGEGVTNGQKEVSLVQFGQEYVSLSWGKRKKVGPTDLPKDPIFSLRYLISLGAYQGVEGVFTPGKQGGEVIFPQLEGLSFPRLTLDKVPSETQQKNQEYPELISPRGLVFRPQTQMTVVGLLNEPKPEEEITVDKEAAGGEFDFVLVAFTDYLRSSQEGVPRHYLAILPTHFPADPDNKNALTLKNLLEANGYSYDPQANEITFIDPQTKKQTKVGINRIEGEELIKDLREATGLAFVDQMKGELIKDPLVPYLDQMPAVWELNREEDEEGNTSFLLQEQNEQGKLVPYARASYDEERQEWRWEKAETALEPGEILIGQDFIGLPQEKILELLSLPENKGKIICPVNVDEKTKMEIKPLEGGDVILITNFKEDNPSERILFNPSNSSGIRLLISSHPENQQRTYSYLLDNNVVLQVAEPKENLITISDTNQQIIELGQFLARGFENISTESFGEYALMVAVAVSGPTRPTEFPETSSMMLKYKDKWVSLAK